MASLLTSHPISIPQFTLRRRLPALPTPCPSLELGRPCLSSAALAVFRNSSLVVRAGHSPYLPSFEEADGLARELFGRLEGLVYTVADAAAEVTESGKESGGGDWLSGITNVLETVLKILKDGLTGLHVPYAYGFAIILLTVLVKAATFPLTRKQVESTLAVRSLQPQVKAIEKRYAGDRERIQLETARLYKLAGVNPLAGCLPTLITIPIWIGLYRALSNVANEGLLSEGFFWIPSLAGPTTIAARQSGSGISWLFPFVDGHPPLGWSDTLAYLVLPVLLVISQFVSAQVMQPSQGGDPSQKNAQAVTKFLPFLIGYFTLSVPSGLSLYWLTNNILSTAQQIWLQKLGGANIPDQEYIARISEDESSAGKISDSQKIVDNAITTNIEKIQETQRSSTGLAPGERFKQIKEQEARRKKEREEIKRAKEADLGSELVNEQKSKLIESSIKELPRSDDGGQRNGDRNGSVKLKDENE